MRSHGRGAGRLGGCAHRPVVRGRYSQFMAATEKTFWTRNEARPRQARYVYAPDLGSVPVAGFPTVILDYRAEDVGPYRSTGEHVIVPGRYERSC